MHERVISISFASVNFLTRGRVSGALNELPAELKSYRENKIVPFVWSGIK